MISSRSEVDATAGLLEGRGAGVRRFMALQRSSRAPACTRLSHTRRSYRPMKPTRNSLLLASLLSFRPSPGVLLAPEEAKKPESQRGPCGRPHLHVKAPEARTHPQPFSSASSLSYQPTRCACWIVSGWHLTHPCCLLAPTPQSHTHGPSAGTISMISMVSCSTPTLRRGLTSSPGAWPRCICPAGGSRCVLNH